MNEIIKQCEPINLMYYVKRAILVYERVFGHTPKVTENQFLEMKLNTNDQLEFESLCKSIEEELVRKVKEADLSDEDKALLAEHQVTDFMELAEVVDFELITDKCHHRKFFNEIENDVIVSNLIGLFERIWEIPYDGSYFIEVYDLNNCPVFFNDYDDMCSFVNNYDVCPYTAFEVKDNAAIELYSA